MLTKKLSRRAIPMAVAAAMVLGLAACSDTAAEQSAGTEQSAAASGATETAQSADAGSAAAGDAKTVVKRGELPSPLGEDAWEAEGGTFTAKDSAKMPITAVFHDVRVAEHDSFYRVVIEFKRDANHEKRGEALPFTARTEWTKEAVAQGKGDTLKTTGTEILDLVVENTTMPNNPEQEAAYYMGEKNVQVGPIDVVVDGTFEGNTHVAIGMDKKREYQASFLDGPSRVVIDIKK